MKKIKIYQESHPFIVLMRSGNIFHIKQEQYEEVANAWVERRPVGIPEYEDPETGKTRPLMLDGIELLDEAKEVQKHHWVKQGGFVCRWNNFHSRQETCDCAPKPSQFTGSSGIGESWDAATKKLGKKGVEKMRKAYDKTMDEFEQIYSEIEQALREKGPDWCQENSSQWSRKARNCNAKINYYALFKINHRLRAEEAVEAFEKQEAEKLKEIEKEVDVIPF